MIDVIDCWQKKALEANISDLLINEDETTYQYEWADNVDEDGNKIQAFGATFHDEGVIKLYRENIENEDEVVFDHLLAYVSLHEWEHYLQGLEYGGAPPPYEWLQNEIDAHKKAYKWYPMLFNNAQPPFRDFTGSMVPTILKADRTYKEKTKDYKALEKQRNQYQSRLDDPKLELTETEKDDLKKKIKEKEEEMEAMEPYFRKHANKLGKGFSNSEYDEDANLECDPAPGNEAD